MKGLYGIRDRVAGELVGLLMMFPAPAAAVRWFGDLLSNKETMPGMHPKDYELCKYAFYESEVDEITGVEREVVMTGLLWLAAQEAAPVDGVVRELELDRRRVG